MKEIETFLKKDKQKKYLEIFLILDELSNKENIISFTYKDNYLLVQVGERDYYKIDMEEVLDDKIRVTNN